MPADRTKAASAEVEQAILDYALEHLTHGCLCVAQTPALSDVQVSSNGVLGEWGRHNPRTKTERLLRLEQIVAERILELSDRQTRQLERFSPQFHARQIEVRRTSELVAVDTFFVGTLKGVGRGYLQSALDCFSRYASGRLYTSKLPVTAVHLLNNDVLPTFESAGARIETVLSDDGRELCGRPDRHPYKLILQLEGIEHRTTRLRRPQSMASSSGRTARCSTSISVSWAAGNSTNRWTRCSVIRKRACGTSTSRPAPGPGDAGPNAGDGLRRGPCTGRAIFTIKSRL